MTDQALVGSCHCGRVQVTLPGLPDHVTHCNCSLCTKTGFQGVYYPSDELELRGETDTYVRSDSIPPTLAQHRCRHCGVVAYWTPLSDPPHVRMGVNARLFEPGTFDGIPIKAVDGRSWPA